MQEMKFKIKDEAHSKAIQEKLFSMGYCWCGRDRAHKKDVKYLYTYISGDITHDTSLEWFAHHGNEEHFLHNGEFMNYEQVMCNVSKSLFRPQKEAARDRMLELMAEITRIIKDDFETSIPEPLVGELYNLLDMH